MGAFPCESCDAVFTHRNKLRAHVNAVHLGKRAHKCTYCMKLFSFAENCRRHVRDVHLKLKPYRCDMCDYRCTSGGNLHIHQRKHTGDAPYKCTICGCKFKSKQYVKKHVRYVHNKEKVLCNYCNAKLGSQQALDRHVKRTHLGIINTCKSCGEASTCGRNVCDECITLTKRKDLKKFCQSCLVQYSVHRTPEYHYCRQCFNRNVLNKPTKIRVEHIIVSSMMEYAPQLMNNIYSCDKAEHVKTEYHHRKDVCWMLKDVERRLVLEIDEDSHSSYNANCELARISKFFEACVYPTLVVRLSTSKLQELDINAFCAFLKKLLRGSDMWPTSFGTASIVYVNYPQSNKHVETAKKSITTGGPIKKVYELSM